MTRSAYVEFKGDDPYFGRYFWNTIAITFGSWAAIESQTSLGVFLAAMFIACLIPIAGFLLFQRSFLRGTGLGGAIKG